MPVLELVTWPNKPKTASFKLDVPYNSQLDNSPNKGQGEGWRQCNATCAAMLCKYFYPTLWTHYKDFANGFLDVLRPFGDTTDHAAITKALQSIGIESYFSYSASEADLAHALFSGTPVLTGTKYKAGGHMILITGRTPELVFAHNPYGERDGISDTWIRTGGTSGKDEVLTPNWLRHCFVDMGPESGWARFVTAVDGKPTGVKANL